ncbi:MAG: hypothetical protein JWO68_2744 [Actinomycetia bacterium]|nr:hypothetical protein [Actinomycetes bacterium]
MSEYWAEVDSAWDERVRRPAPRRIGPVRGGVLAAMMLGLQEALEPQTRDEVVFEVEVDRPEGPIDGVVLHFDPASPRRTVAVLGSVTPPP